MIQFNRIIQVIIDNSNCMSRYYDIMSIQPLVVIHKAIHGRGTCPACAHVPNAYARFSGCYGMF